MTNKHLTTLTSVQIAAAFNAVFKDVKPPVTARPPGPEDLLAPFKKEIMKQRRRGLTWDQIAVGMADPRIAQKTSAKTLRRCFGTKKPPTPPPAAEPVTRLILDPATGQLKSVPRG